MKAGVGTDADRRALDAEHRSRGQRRAQMVLHQAPLVRGGIQVVGRSGIGHQSAEPQVRLFMNVVGQPLKVGAVARQATTIAIDVNRDQ